MRDKKSHRGSLRAWLRYGLAALAVVMAAEASPNRARADTINPLDHVASDSPVHTQLLPSGYGNGTGAGAQFPHSQSNEWLLSTSDGWLLRYDGRSFQSAIDTGLPLTGVDYTSSDDVVVSAGKTLYFGNLSGGTFNQTSSLDLILPSDITDVSHGYGMADAFIATGDGIYAVNGNDVEKIDDTIVQSYDVIKLDPAVYSNDMGQLAGEDYRLIDSDGEFLSGPNTGKLVSLNNYTTIRGMAQTKDEVYGTMNTAVQAWNNQEYASGIIPEPGTFTLLTIGGSAFLVRRKEQKE